MNSTQSVHAYLTTAPTSQFLKQEVSVLDHWQGNEHLLWRVQCRGQEAVLKFYLDAGQARSRRQFDGQQLFSPMGLAPRPLWFDRYPEGLSRQILVYEWVEGKSLERPNLQQLQALATTVAQVHGSDPTDVRRFCPHPINLGYFWQVQQGSFRPIRDWLEEQKADRFHSLFNQIILKVTEVVENALPLWQQSPPTPVHGDLKLENCVDSFGVAVLLDWELFGLGDPALEVANFLYLHQSSLTESERQAWLDHYLMHFERSQLTEQIGIYAQLLPFRSVCYLLDGLRTSSTDIEDDILLFLSSTLQSNLQQINEMFEINTIDIKGAVEPLFQKRTIVPRES